jgi:hypothetical protein
MTADSRTKLFAGTHRTNAVVAQPHRACICSRQARDRPGPAITVLAAYVRGGVLRAMVRDR